MHASTEGTMENMCKQLVYAIIPQQYPEIYKYEQKTGCMLDACLQMDEMLRSGATRAGHID